QVAVTELRPRLDLREDLALLGQEVRGAIDPEALVAWGEAPVVLASQKVRYMAAALAALTVLALIGWDAGFGLTPFLVMALCEQAFLRPYRARIKQVVRSVDKPAQHLALFALVLQRIEQERFD